jgi:hypothetical protein
VYEGSDGTDTYFAGVFAEYYDIEVHKIQHDTTTGTFQQTLLTLSGYDGVSSIKAQSATDAYFLMYSVA